MPELNIPLLVKTLDHVEAHPEEHVQGTWWSEALPIEIEEHPGHCGTVGCFAGHAANLAGYEIQLLPSQFTARVATPEGLVEVREVAEAELGLTFTQSCVLFYYENSRKDLRTLVDDLVRTGHIDPTHVHPGYGELRPSEEREL